jgi:hypothetical protein
LAQAVNAEPTVPAVMHVVWSGAGTTAPFSSLTGSGLTVDLGNAAFASGTIQIGAESIDITKLAASPQVVPAVASTPTAAGLPPLFVPVFAVGPGAVGTLVTTSVDCFNTFPAFVTQLGTTFATPTAATQLVAAGVYNRATNIFTASRINVVL